MFSPIYCVLLWFLPVLYYSGSMASDFQPYLTLYPPGDLDYTDVLVRRVGDNLTLACELKGDAAPRIYVWNFVPSDNASGVDVSLSIDPRGPALGSHLSKRNVTVSDSGHYVCSAPPYSVTKFVLVQTRGPIQCARSAFWCGNHCVLPSYVCDGYKDCRMGEDEAPELCMHQPCAGADKLNCSSGRCISSAACCRRRDALCKQPTCCDEHHMYSVMEGFVEPEYPPLFEDRRAPDEYGFIQSTIYTVTACALIFMIAVVLLVSAICKMHMKRAALRNYTHAATHHYDQRFAQQTHRFPPCYEASRLLEQERAMQSPSHSPVRSAGSSPAHNAGSQCNPDYPTSGTGGNGPGGRGFPLAALSAVFTQRYRQIPTQCLDVEMTDVRHNSCNTSPQHNQNSTTLDNYRSPTFCDLNSDLFFNQDNLNCGRELNYMGGLEYLPRPRNNVGRARPLTLQLGRFQLSIPRLGRRQSLDRRPDTPNVAELNIDDLDFVRLNSNDTYTLNGRTIRLLGANFENYPVLDESSRPPPYNDAMRYKLYGPPPEYLSRDRLNERDNTEERARSNVEMPPCYDELASGVAAATENVAATTATENVVAVVNATANVVAVVNATENVVAAINTTENEVDVVNATENVVETDNLVATTTDNVAVVAATQQNNNDSDNNNAVERNGNGNTVVDNSVVRALDAQNNFDATTRGSDVTFENLSSVIDNLPAIDSDVNANERDVTSYATSAVS